MISYREQREECVGYGYVEVGGVSVGAGHKRSKCLYSGQICRKSLCPVIKQLHGCPNLSQARIDLIKKYNLQEQFEEEMA
jgi:hypothetical protein